ncbi:MAG TPA: malto-oligosyltrehalose trehalohydrolase [Pirellulales bacterium]|nr:malto-oligosyltrehalose trehalohydrolase [Pirellulales bacterium]
MNRKRFEPVPIGAEVLGSQRVRFRVWAPARRRIRLVIESTSAAQHAASNASREVELDNEGTGYFSIETDAGPGTRYRYRIDDGEELYCDPASRSQPQGPRGPSQVVDPHAFAWTDVRWPGVQRRGHVIYELHVGTFTAEGTWQAAAEQLPEIADLGITLLELMPVAEFPGRYGWSYDGVNLFAPSHRYGAPDDFRHFVDRAHSVGLGVALDVVYNHFGCSDCDIHHFTRDYISDKYKNEWGDAINFDGENSAGVREFFLANVRHWIDEYHLDGLRIDATQAFHDSSSDHILGSLVREARRAAGRRSIIVIAESEPQDVRMLRSSERGGFDMDMAWNDDFHHTALVRATGRNEAYYTDYLGKAQEFVAALKWGYLYQGQRYTWQKHRRGTPALDLPSWAFINYLQNHDQIANNGMGERLHERTSAGLLRTLTTVLLLGPGTPLLFQGQEFAASTPFLYFCDVGDPLAAEVTAGRLKFLSQFRSLALPEMQQRVPTPSDPATFDRCRLRFDDRRRNAPIYRLHRDLIHLRQSDPCLAAQQKDALHGAVLNEDCFIVRFIQPTEQRLLVVNLGRDLHLDPAPEPLLAPPEGQRWALFFSSDDISYGGHGTPEVDTDENWRIPGQTALLLIPRAMNVDES